MRSLRVGAIAALVLVAASAAWMARSGPAPTSSAGSGFAAVACTSGRACLAVGSQTSPADLEAPLSATRDGPHWSLRRVPSSSPIADSAMESVACQSPTSCMAVGRQEAPATSFGAGTPEGQPLARSWDGRGWQIHPIQGPPGALDSALHGVACTPATCVAVGDGDTRSGIELTFAELWDGTGWRLSLTPNPGLAEDSFLDAVTCPSPTSCIAVGHYEYEVRELSSRRATLAERWNGRDWKVMRSANPPGSQGAELKAVDCASPRSCMAVGSQRLPTGAYSTLAERWDGRAWTIVPTPSSGRSPDAELDAVSCPLPDRCIAVGFLQQRSGAVMLAESWDGVRWAIQRTPVLAGTADSALNAIDCTSPSSCVAVGTYRRPSLLQVAFAAAWDGTAWKTEPLPGLPG